MLSLNYGYLNNIETSKFLPVVILLPNIQEAQIYGQYAYIVFHQHKTCFVQIHISWRQFKCFLIMMIGKSYADLVACS